MPVEDHTSQLRRAAEAARQTNVVSEGLGKLKAIGGMMLALELVTLGFGIFHLLEGDLFISAVALGAEIGIVALHSVGMSIERQLHHENTNRIDLLQEEVDDKEDQTQGVAEAFNLRVGRWYRAMRRRRQPTSSPNQRLELRSPTTRQPAQADRQLEAPGMRQLVQPVALAELANEPVGVPR